MAAAGEDQRWSCRAGQGGVGRVGGEGGIPPCEDHCPRPMHTMLAGSKPLLLGAISDRPRLGYHQTDPFLTNETAGK